MSNGTKERPAPRPGPGHGPMGMGGGMPAAKPLDFRASMGRLLDRLRPERVTITGILVLAVASVAAAVTGPKLLGRATDVIFTGVVSAMLPAGTTQAEAVAGLRAQGQETLADMIAAMDLVPGAGMDTGALAAVLALVVGVYLVAWLFGWLQGRLTTDLVQRTVARMRRDVQLKIGRVPLREVDRRSRGDLLSRVTNDVDNLAQTMQQVLSQLISAVFTVLGVIVMMVWISPLLALIALLLIPAAGVVTAIIAKRSQPQFVAQWKSTGDLTAHIEEIYTGHEVVKVYGRSRAAAEAFAVHNDELYESSFKANFISGLIQPAVMFLGNLNFVVIAVIGGLRVANGQLSLGDVQAFIQYSRQFAQPITQVASMANLVQSGVASAERVFEFLDLPEESPDPEPTLRREDVRGRVELRDVSFRYEADQPLIEHLDLTVEPGTTVAIVGHTGAGKTTLVNLLLRFYDLDGGAILLDGRDIATLGREEVRRGFGMVLQDTWLFGGTIYDNIAYGKAGATREEVLEAARVTHVDHFVQTLPDGYETVIDEEGSNVSAGERQLLTIARAFLADPAILVLDEATSSVDTRTEVLVQHAMARLREGRTSFVIAHRLSTIRDADVILVMEHGSIVEQGNHEGLLAADGAYAALYRSQFAAAVDEVD